MSKRFISLGVMLGMALVLSGCANNVHDNGPDSGHSAGWYLKHPAARSAENKWCAKQPIATQQHDQSCTEVGGGGELDYDFARSAANLGPIPTKLPAGRGAPVPAS